MWTLWAVRFGQNCAHQSIFRLLWLLLWFPVISWWAMKNKQINCEKCLNYYWRWCGNGAQSASGRRRRCSSRCNVNINVSVILIRINHNFHINTDLMAIIIIIRRLKLYRRKYMWSVLVWRTTLRTNSNFHQTHTRLHFQMCARAAHVCWVCVCERVSFRIRERLSTTKAHFMTNPKWLSLRCIDGERLDALIARQHANLH